MTVQPPDPADIRRAEFRRRYIGLRPWQTHSEILAVAGGVYIVRGLMFIFVDQVPTQTDMLRLPLAFAPLQFWGVCFVIVGLLALFSTRWPPVSKTWGYAALAGLAAWWACSYLLSLAFGAPWASLGGGLLWALVAYLWWRIAALINPDDIPKETTSETTKGW